jgi:hypothetical protein
MVLPWCFDDGWYYHCIRTIRPFGSYRITHRHNADWCNSQFGYCHISVDDRDLAYIYYFKTEEHALMFKIGAGGTYSYAPR